MQLQKQAHEENLDADEDEANDIYLIPALMWTKHMGNVMQ